MSHLGLIDYPESSKSRPIDMKRKTPDEVVSPSILGTWLSESGGRLSPCRPMLEIFYLKIYLAWGSFGCPIFMDHLICSAGSMRWSPLKFGSMNKWVRGRLSPLPTYDSHTINGRSMSPVTTIKIKINVLVRKLFSSMKSFTSTSPKNIAMVFVKKCHSDTSALEV
jgi:hypothetical protein